LSKDFLQRLDADLHLNKEEHEAIQKIIRDGQNQMRKVVQDARLEIREVLTAEQREQFDELMKRPFHKPLFSTNAPPTAPPAPAAAAVAPTNAP
jgi:signal transduction histidine kinase